MACNPPYARGLTGQWDKCRFPGVLRQDCYDYINFDYDCSGKPYCPDRVVVIEVCDTNAARDDNIKVTLNGTVIADVLDFSKDERNGYFLISDPDATLEASESSISQCHGTSPGLPISVKRFGSGAIKGGTNTINVKIVQQNFNGNAGAFNVRSYVKRDGKLVCGCTIGTVPYGAEGDYTFTYDNCCGSSDAPPCSTPSPTTIPGGGGGGSSDEKTGLFIERSEYPVFQSFGLDDYLPNFAPFQAEPEHIFSTQATGSCNITAQLRTTGCCLELEESTGRMYAVGAGTVSARIISGFCSSCIDFSVYINDKKNSAVVRDGSTITVSGRSTKCKCNKKTPWRTPGGFKPSPCNKGPAPTPGPLRILKNIETGVYQIELNTNSSQNDCGCG